MGCVDQEYYTRFSIINDFAKDLEGLSQHLFYCEKIPPDVNIEISSDCWTYTQLQTAKNGYRYIGSNSCLDKLN